MTGPSTTTDCAQYSWEPQPVGVSGFGDPVALRSGTTEMRSTNSQPIPLRLHNQTAMGISLAPSKQTGSSGRRRGASLHGNRREHENKGGTHSLGITPVQGSPSVPVRKSVDYVFYRDSQGQIDMATPGDPYPVDSLLLALGTPDGLTLLFNGPINPLFTTHGERVEIEQVYSKLTGGAQ